MTDRPSLNDIKDSKTFREFYWLKEELADFCRRNGLSARGGKTELANRVSHFLDTGDIIPALPAQKKTSKTDMPDVIEADEKIEENFVCSEKHRAFFREHIGRGFTFNVAFQKWLKDNAGKTYREAIEAYGKILEEKKTKKTAIDAQFEYNAYIRAFFADNRGKTLEDAVKCWNYKKRQKGNNAYERTDLSAAEEKTQTALRKNK